MCVCVCNNSRIIISACIVKGWKWKTDEMSRDGGNNSKSEATKTEEKPTEDETTASATTATPISEQRDENSTKDGNREEHLINIHKSTLGQMMSEEAFRCQEKCLEEKKSTFSYYVDSSSHTQSPPERFDKACECQDGDVANVERVTGEDVAVIGMAGGYGYI